MTPLIESKTPNKALKISNLDIQEGQVFPIVPHVYVLLSNAFCNIHLIGFPEFNLIIRNMEKQKYQIIEEFNWILIIQSCLHFREENCICFEKKYSDAPKTGQPRSGFIWILDTWVSGFIMATCCSESAQ